MPVGGNDYLLSSSLTGRLPNKLRNILTLVYEIEPVDGNSVIINFATGRLLKIVHKLLFVIARTHLKIVSFIMN